MTSDLYQQLVLENYRRPMNFGEMKSPSVKLSDSNPLCGDEITVFLKVKKNRVADVKFTGRGCAIFTASASLLTESVKGKSVLALTKLKKQDALDLIGIDLSPVRIKCALLPLKALKLAGYYARGEKDARVSLDELSK